MTEKKVYLALIYEKVEANALYLPEGAYLFDVPATVPEERNVLEELEELLTRPAYLLHLPEEPASGPRRTAAQQRQGHN